MMIQVNDLLMEGLLNKTVVFMKMDNNKFDKNGELKNGVHKEYFKDGSVSCEGEFKDGERTGQWKYYLAIVFSSSGKH
jgi:antitoxin component YwqK of YwqJK toxin-antitoxin module